MNNQEGFNFIQKYFNELFGNHNIDALDHYLDKSYSDDDIGDPAIDHINNSKLFLRELFSEKPTIGVNVVNAITHDDVITAFIEWFVIEDGNKRIIRKGVALFIVKDQKILKRHTFLYYDEQW
jgi:hypothetical protein